MNWTTRQTTCALLLLGATSAQKAPVRADQPWIPPSSGAPARQEAKVKPIDPSHVYTLPELIDLAEEQNPNTRAAWQAAKVRAGQLGIARSELFPTLAAVAIANTLRTGVLLGPTFVRQTEGVFEPVVRVSYTVFDFGQRSDRIAAAREQLAAANFAFNTVHLNILFEVSRRYYRLLNTLGQQDAAELNLKNAQTVAQAVEARLQNGLATLPDALEARAAAAQADYELQAAIGQVEIARGDLLSLLGERPSLALKVQPLEELNVPDHIDDEAEAAIERALAQRPELAQRVAEKQGATAGIRAARAAYLPTLDFQGDGGEVRAYGRQNQLPGTYAGPVEYWNVTTSLRWELFDGGRREAELARSHAEERRAQAEIDEASDQIEEQVWMAYADLQTAFRQRRAAQALLEASRSSYDAALKSYQFGLRNTVDVVSSQRTLAQALSQDVSARAGVLTQLSALAYRTGDLIQHPKGKTP